MSKPVSFAKLHGVVFVPGLGQIPETVDKSAFSAVQDLKMSLSENEKFLEISLKGKNGIGSYLVEVPLTNVSHLVRSK